MTCPEEAATPQPVAKVGRMHDRLRTYLVVLVSLGWVFNLVAPAIVESYDSNLAANGPLLLILGSLFATKKGGKKE